MSLASASRSALRLSHVAQRVSQRIRHLHIKNINGGLQSIVAPGHVHEGGHLPFSYRRKPAFLGKFAAFCTAGFSIPFAAVLLVKFTSETKLLLGPDGEFESEVVKRMNLFTVCLAKKFPHESYHVAVMQDVALSPPTHFHLGVVLSSIMQYYDRAHEHASDRATPGVSTSVYFYSMVLAVTVAEENIPSKPTAVV
ncbi:hypothetical protein EV368DRAFT_68316 [Lentinula lateritia]|uniref:Uncharacterized protein n=1 Tax=Lentinula aff. lateritia TaxID=2804960 RepID=A0ACC1UBV3_9AGAR|nr:hypothetical protein F5876DRAFT_62420 [Lentinula aff. lateritia]KAJ3848387.1 hypothetical protein EV368DRAFT_68316 [Lentinula lateritia]